MVDAKRSRATPLHYGLPEEIVVWEILVHLRPKPLRCRAVCRAWRRATSTREFLLAHHGRQPSLPLTASYEHGGSHILAYDHRAVDEAQIHTVAQLDGVFRLEASCDGLFVLSRHDCAFSICNPATRQYAPLGRARDLTIAGMYLHRPTGEYRLLLYRSNNMRWMGMDLFPEGQIGWYVFALGSDQPPRYIPETRLELRFTPTLVHDNLHWFIVQDRPERKLLVVFDTIAESFRQMHAPIVPIESNIFKMDSTLGISTSKIYATRTVDIWVLQNYESKVWELKYQIKFPDAEISRRIEGYKYGWDVKAVSRQGDVFLLLGFDRWLFHIDSDGKLVASFHKDSQGLRDSKFCLKQTLFPHIFFMEQEGHVVNASPFN